MSPNVTKGNVYKYKNMGHMHYILFSPVIQVDYIVSEKVNQSESRIYRVRETGS
jgi:hypothetical protein